MFLRCLHSLSLICGLRHGAPAVCNYADAWELGVREVPRSGGRHASDLRGLIHRCNLGPLIWAGIDFVALHVVLPGYPVLGRRDHDLSDEGVAELWKGALLFWHRL